MIGEQLIYWSVSVSVPILLGTACVCAVVFAYRYLKRK